MPALEESPKLTIRETQVRDLILRGMVHKEIATELNISERTVKAHAGTLYRKYGVGSKGRLVAKLLSGQV